MKTERFNEIKRRYLENEGNTQEQWVRAAKDLLAEIPQEGRSSRVKEIDAAIQAAGRKRDQQPQGYGWWFTVLGELIGLVEAPKGSEKPTDDEVEAAGEAIEIRKEIARKYDARKVGENLPSNAAEYSRSEEVPAQEARHR